MEPILENQNFELYLDGELKRWEVSGKEYSSGHVSYQWHGTGAIVIKALDETIQFQFKGPTTSNGEHAKNPSDLVLMTTRHKKGCWWEQAPLDELVLPEMREEMVDLVCQRLLEKIKKCSDPIKYIEIEAMKFEALVASGFVADYNGQIALTLV
ncbi:MAG: hypothetical protein Q8O98_02775 [bacterium]|nr:hypothetical protein [bacterium]